MPGSLGVEQRYGTVSITPAQIRGAAMNSVIHEARGLIWFNQAMDEGGACQTGNAIRAAQTNPAWACAPHIEAMGQVNNFILSLAPVLNTQSYQWTFGPNLDTMLKVKDGYAYIFAMTSGTAGSRQFTLPPEITGTSVEVIGENRSLPVSNQGFTDSFAQESTYHVYRIRI